MIKEKNHWKFREICKKHRITLKNGRCCSRYAITRIEYYPNYGVRLSCKCGESVLILKRADFPDIKTEEEFVCMVAEEWNKGHTNW